jgi:hypothetical protein
MLLVFHIIVALTGLVIAALSFFSPSFTKLRVLSGTTALTFISGSVLAIKTHSSLARVCLSGLLYLGVVLASTVFSYKKLAKADSVIKSN